jgi:hypothetical protein
MPSKNPAEQLEQRTRIAINSIDRINGSPDVFVVNVNTREFASYAKTPVMLKLDYVGPLYISSSIGLNYFDAIQIHVDNIPQYQSWDTRTGSQSTMIGMLVRDHAVLQSSIDPASSSKLQAWTFQFDHEPMYVTPDVWQLKTWNVRLRFSDTRSDSFLTDYAAKQMSDTLALQDWTMVLQIIKKDY